MKLKQTFFALLVTFILSVSFYAQDWSLPKDNTPKEVITWATPLSFVKNSEYPFHGTISYYNYLGERKQRRDDKTGSYILRIPNKFKGNGLSKTGYTHFKVTWAVGEPDVNAGYTETKISWLSDWQQRAENPILSYQTDYDVGTVTFLNDVIINGSVAFPKGYTRTVGDSGIGHSCYSELKEEVSIAS